MTTSRRSLILLLTLVGVLAASRETSQAQGFVSKLPVARLEVGYVLDGSGMNARVTLGTLRGEAMDFVIHDAAAMDVVLRMADARARGASVFAEVQNHQVKALILSTP